MADSPIDLKKWFSGVTDTIGGAASAYAEKQIGQLAQQVRTRLAAERKIQPGQVTDLDIAEYFSSMPSVGLTRVVDARMAEMNKGFANAVLVTGGAVVLGMLLSALIRR